MASATSSRLCLAAISWALLLLSVAHGQLPKGIVVEPVAFKADEDTPTQPYLSLNIAGHTGTINSLVFGPDSKTLYSAGQDKVVNVWKFGGARAKAFIVEPVGWHHAQTIRWEIARSLRGSIYSVAISPRGDTVAIGGYGARGSAGDIVFADTTDGSIKASARGLHTQNVYSLSYSADGSFLVSADLAGTTVLWDLRGVVPRGRVLRSDGRVSSSAGDVFAGTSHVILRRFKGMKKFNQGEMPQFELDYYDIARGNSAGMAPIDLYVKIMAVAATDDRRYVAVCDATGTTHLYKTGDRAAKKLIQRSVVKSMSFSKDGRFLAVGTIAGFGKPPQVHLWDIRTGEHLFQHDQERAVASVAFSPDGRWLASNGGESHHVYLWEFNGNGRLVKERPEILRGGDRIVDVQPARRAEDFQTLIRTNTKEERIFDPSKIEEDPLRILPNAKAMAVEGVDRGPWTLKQVNGPTRLQLFQRGAPRGTISLDQAQQGGIATPDSYCIVPDEFGRPVAVAVGTDTQCEVFVFELADRGECSILRRFRGHFADVTSLKLTGDKRYLVSGSADGTVRYWKLEGLMDDQLSCRWGLKVAGTGTGRGLKVTACPDSSPLFQKGVRVGDVIEKMVWPENESGDGRTLGTVDTAAMARQLQTLPWSKQVSMYVRRKGELQPAINVVAGWHHLLAVYVHNEDWIAWHPSGYYACSPGGNRLIGWQVNKDVGETPKLFPAVRFHESLYNPRAMARLLEAGGLEDADVAVSQPPSPPIVELIAPAQRRFESKEPVVVIRARARATGDEPISSMKLLINNVPAAQHTKAMEVVASDHRMDWVQREWTVKLEPGEHTIAVRADTKSAHAFSTSASVAYAPARARRTLHLLAVAVNEYKDESVSDLNFCVKDSTRIADIFQKRSVGLFDDVRITTLFDEDATRSEVESAFTAVADAAGMNDLVVLFYSGHGHRVDDRFYFVSHDANLKNLREKGVPEDSIKAFCQDVAAKGSKMMIMVDACHSGGMRLERLTADMATDDFRVAMMASSKGDEFSYEDAAFGGGAFTQALWLGMHEGEADASMVADGRVDNDELGVYVRRRVQMLIKTIAPRLKRDNPVFFADREPTQTPVNNFQALDPIGLTLLPE